MGPADRMIRLIISALFVILYFNGIVVGTLGLVLVALAGIFTLTSIVRFCPIYAMLGLRTCPK